MTSVNSSEDSVPTAILLYTFESKGENELGVDGTYRITFHLTQINRLIFSHLCRHNDIINT